MEIVSLYFACEAKLVLRFPHYVYTVLLISSLGWIRKGGREKKFNSDFETRQVVFGNALEKLLEFRLILWIERFSCLLMHWNIIQALIFFHGGGPISRKP